MSKTYTAGREVNAAQACNGAAHSEYISRLNSIEERLVELNKVLDNHAKLAGHHWGHVGDLGMIDERLADLLSSFSAALKV